MNSLLSNHRDQVIKSLNFDDFTVDIIEAEAKRLKSLSLIARHPFLFHALLAILTNIIFPLKGLRRKVRVENDDFIFVSCPDTAFRTKTLPLIAGGLEYVIIYLPNFHIPTSIRYNVFFKSVGVRAFFPTIKIKHVLDARRKLVKMKREIRGINNEFETAKQLSVIASFLIYDGVVKDYLKQVELFKGKWILEHQKFYFLSTVSNLHARGIKTTELQHGIFFEPVYDFIPLICDKVLCCSEREKKIYIENGTEEKRVEVFGVPLQTLQHESNVSKSDKHYDLLVLMTLVNEQDYELINSVLRFVKNNYHSVLVRMRPRSRKNDEEMLSEVLYGMTLSDSDSSIMEDIRICDKVISFSADANIEVSKQHKPFIYVWVGDNPDEVKNTKCVNMTNYETEIKKLMENEFYSTFSEKQYIEILGETDIDVLRDEFYKYIKNT